MHERAWLAHIPGNLYSCAMIHTQYFLVLFPLAGNYSFWQEIISLDRKLFPLTGTYSCGRKSFRLAENYFTWQEIILLGRKSFHLAGNYLLWQEIISFKRSDFIWQGIISICLETISFGRKFSSTVNYFLWKETISFGRKLFPLTGNYFLLILWENLCFNLFSLLLNPIRDMNYPWFWPDPFLDIYNAWFWPDISPEIWGFPVILDARMTVKSPPCSFPHIFLTSHSKFVFVPLENLRYIQLANLDQQFLQVCLVDTSMIGWPFVSCLIFSNLI